MPTKKNEPRKVDVNGRMLPHSVEAEQSVLGCAMINDNAAVYMLENLTAVAFYTESHQLIFTAMNDIKVNRAKIDVVTLVDALEKKDKLTLAGGLQYINTISTFVPDAANYRSYVEIVRNKHILRSLVRTCSETIEGAFRNEDSGELLNATEKSIYDVAKSQEKGKLVPIAEVLPDVIQKFRALEDPASQRGIPTGFVGINAITNGLQRSDLVLVAARPSVGKTAFAMNLISNIALNDGYNDGGVKKKYSCAVFSLEMTREQLTQRVLASVSGVSLERIGKGKMDTADWKKIMQARTALATTHIFIDDTSLIKPIQIMEKCIRLRNQYGLDVVMIDYLQLMTGDGESESRQNEVSSITRYLKIMAKELAVPVILLSQLSRKVENRPDKTPMLSDLRESGAIEQDADIVMFIHREKDVDNPTEDAEIIIAKHRNGALGRVKLRYIGECTKFIDDPSQYNVKVEQNLPPPPASVRPVQGDSEALLAPQSADSAVAEFTSQTEEPFGEAAATAEGKPAEKAEFYAYGAPEEPDEEDDDSPDLGEMF